MNFAVVRTKYYKHQSAVCVLDHAHAKRNGFTQSGNVHSDFSHNNIGSYSTFKSSLSAYESTRVKHKNVTGKKPRSDMNTLFEHVVVLSVAQFEKLEKKHGTEKAKELVLESLQDYAQKIKKVFGFEVLGIDLHLDEGTLEEDGSFKRNIHAHVMFYNYDFDKKISPLRGLRARGKNKNGKKEFLNPNFEKMQNLVADSFDDLGFARGKSNGLDNIENKDKPSYIRGLAKKEQLILNELENKVQNIRGLAETEQLILNELENKSQNNIEQMASVQLEIANAKNNQINAKNDLIQLQDQKAKSESDFLRLKKQINDSTNTLNTINEQINKAEHTKTIAERPLLEFLGPICELMKDLSIAMNTDSLRCLQEQIEKIDDYKKTNEIILPEQIESGIDAALQPYRKRTPTRRV